MEHKMMQHKTKIESQLEMMGRSRLFGNGRWLAEGMEAKRLTEMLEKMGLEQRTLDNSSKNTPLGNELNVDLHMVFLGLWEPLSMIGTLEDQGLLDPDEVDRLNNLVCEDEEDFEPILRARVQRAYREYYKTTWLL
jgi:hypothetical protein